MASAHFGSVEAYVAAQTDDVAAVLGRVRGAIVEALPEAEECIAYNLPTYKMRGKAVIHFAAWKRHYSIYPASKELVAAFGEELGTAVVEKSTLRFSYDEDVPVRLIARIAKFRAGEVGER